MADPSHSPEIVRLTELLDKNPESKMFVPLAEAYLQSKMTDEAVSVLSKGIERHPMFVAARVMLGKIFLEKGAMPEAKVQFEEVRLIAPHNIPSLKGLAMIAQHEGRKEETRTLYTQVLQIDPSDRAAALALKHPSDVEDKGIVGSGNSDEAAADVLDTPAPGTSEKNKIQDDGNAKLKDDNEGEGVAPPVDMPRENRHSKAAPPSETLDAEEPVEDEPHMTHTMAALYMAQGHFQKAVDIYEKLIAEDSNDEVSAQGLKQALEARAGNTSSSEDPAHLSTERKIERLQAWLEVIQKKKKD